jgi:hypothetical protein
VEFFGLALSRLLPSDREKGFRGTACLRAGTLSTSGRKRAKKIHKEVSSLTLWNDAS